eukprot:1782270-Amphidinium_carterae.1
MATSPQCKRTACLEFEPSLRVLSEGISNDAKFDAPHAAEPASPIRFHDISYARLIHKVAHPQFPEARLATRAWVAASDGALQHAHSGLLPRF